MTNFVELVLQTVREYDTLPEEEFFRREQLFPFSANPPPEKALLYALRVSGAGVRAKTLSTLKSRWEVTNSGAGGYGLEMGEYSPAYPTCASFLADRFLGRLQYLVDQVVAEAEEKAGKRESSQAKRNVYLKAIEKLEADARGMTPPLPGAEECVEQAIQRLRQQATSLGE